MGFALRRFSLSHGFSALALVAMVGCGGSETNVIDLSQVPSGTGGGGGVVALPPEIDASCPQTPANVTLDVAPQPDVGRNLLTIPAGQTLAFRFNISSNTQFVRLSHYPISGQATSAVLKDVSISLCPGDFSANLAAKCVSNAQLAATPHATLVGNIMWSAVACELEVGKNYFFNVKLTNPGASPWAVGVIRRVAAQ